MATHLPVVGGHENGVGATQRTDNWWASPLAIFTGLSAFIIYVNWALFTGEHYWANGSYLSPFYSPVLFTDLDAAGSAPLDVAWFGAWPTWWPEFLPPSPAIFILVFPASFRFTCYYYRKAYYRAFAGSPAGCAVGPLGSGKPYNGETKLMIFQNLHRYAMYFAVIFIFLLAHDAYMGFFRDGVFGFGFGTLVLILNVVFLGGYTFGCHSFRHLIGGHDDCMSCGQKTMKHGAWKKATWLNERHQLFAWTSLFWVMFTDFYVRMVSMGWITDLNTWDL
jgi:hypothetical protein